MATVSIVSFVMHNVPFKVAVVFWSFENEQ